MAFFPCYKVVISLATLLVFIGISSARKGLSDQFYDKSCPHFQDIVKGGVQAELRTDHRMGASILRLHFHDCFVNGCDASVLLDDTPKFKGEQGAAPNKNSLRGFKVIEKIKGNVEKVCRGVVSCADILALAARESVVQLGGLSWDLDFGRRDSITANQSAAAQHLPSPTWNVDKLISNFSILGFSVQDLVALSGAHTIGAAKCINFRSRLYNERNIDGTFAYIAKQNCSRSTQDDNKLAPLDYNSPITFDNFYYTNLVSNKGLLHSDQELYNRNPETIRIVKRYKYNQTAFFADFASAMTKMSKLPPPPNTPGEIRKNCRKTN